MATYYKKIKLSKDTSVVAMGSKNKGIYDFQNMMDPDMRSYLLNKVRGQQIDSEYTQEHIKNLIRDYEDL